MSQQAYEHMKAAWIAKNPGATPAQYAQAMRNLARKAGV